MSVTEENWPVVKNRKIWGTNKKMQTEKILRDDVLIFYITKTGMFGGIFRVISEWRSADSPIFPDECNRNKVLYPFQCDLEQVLIGDAVFNELIQKLSITKNKEYPYLVLQTSRSGSGNHGKPISIEDYEIIEKDMRKPFESDKVDTEDHENIIMKLTEIGQVMGFEPTTEQEDILVAKGSKVDLVWKIQSPYVRIKYVFEVQSKGSIKSLIINLFKSMNDKATKKVVVVSDHLQLEEVKKQVEEWSVISDDIKQKFVYLDIKTANQIHDHIEQLRAFKNNLELL